MRNEKENAPNFTNEEFNFWLYYFRLGQNIFDRHVDNPSPVTPLHIYPTYNGKEDIICYVEELNQTIASFKFIESSILSIKKYSSQDKNYRRTNAHLTRLRICTTPDAMPLFTGMEERAHAYFHTHVKKTLKKDEIVFTGKYDGSDSSEEYFFRKLIQIILNNNLPVHPLPNSLNSA